MTSTTLHLVPDPEDLASGAPLPVGHPEVADDQADTTPADPVAGTAPFAGVYTMVDGVVEAPPSTDSSLPPVIAEWLRSSAGRRAMVATTLRRWRYVTAFHTLRLPTYWARLARRAPCGLWRIVVALTVWSTDPGVRASLEAMRAGVGGAGLERLERQHCEAVRIRVAADVALLAVVVAVVFVWLALPAIWQATAAAVVLPIVGYIGRNRGRPIVERVIFHGVEVPKLTESLIIQALMNSRIPGVAAAFKTQGDRAVRWVKPPTRTRVGYEVVLDLPGGVTVEDAANKTGNIASGLSRPTSTVWLSGISEEEGGHEGRLRMVVTDAPMRAATPPMWPLADPASGTFDIFQPIPLGVDYLGEPVTVRLMFRAGIVGALPRMGKSFTLRLMLLGAALDPTVELHIYDLKGGADFLDLGNGRPVGTGVAHAFRSGSSPADALAMLADLHAMKADMERRYSTIRKLVETDLARCPEGKVTRELANDRSLGLHPVILAIDETQVCFADWPDAKEFIALVTDLAKRGPAAGITVLLATQSVDSTTIPTSISRMASIRFCLRVTDHTASELILGTGTYRRGFQPSNLSIDDQGIGYLAGEGDLTKLVRCCFVDGPEASKIAARARKLREAANRLTGLAAGETEPDLDLDGVVEHLFTVWPEGPKGPLVREHCVVLAERLAEFNPALYNGFTGEQVTLAVKPHGIEVKGCKVRNRTTSGIAYADLSAVVDRRADERAQAAKPDPEPVLALVGAADDEELDGYGLGPAWDGDEPGGEA